MDHVTWTASFNDDFKFTNWPQIDAGLKNALTSVGIISEFQQLLLDIKEIEKTLYKNTMSSTYNLKNKTLIKIHRIPDSDIVVEMYNTFLRNHKKELEELSTTGVYLSELVVEKDVETNQERVKKTLEKLPKFTLDSKSILKNTIPLHTEYTDYGVLYIRQDYIEIWFDAGHIDFIRNLSYDLYENLYYKVYKQDQLINSDIIRFAFPRQYDYEPAPHYVSLACPDSQCGISCLQDIIDQKINTDYLKLYIDQTREVITKWKTVTDLFPDDPIRLENRALDSVGYYFIFLGTNRDHSLSKFIDLQIDYISQLIDYLNSPSIDKEEIIRYASVSYSK